jgi:hypothetical protein
VQLTLGELAGAASEELLALSVGVGLGVLTELMAEAADTTPTAGPCVTAMRLRRDARRSARTVQRPRARASDNSGEVALKMYAQSRS